jgi:hypothetical protein
MASFNISDDQFGKLASTVVAEELENRCVELITKEVLRPMLKDILAQVEINVNSYRDLMQGEEKVVVEVRFSD